MARFNADATNAARVVEQRIWFPYLTYMDQVYLALFKWLLEHTCCIDELLGSFAED